MAKLVAEFYAPRGIDVSFSEAPAQRDSIVILTKGFLLKSCSDDLLRLKEQGNILIADYVDHPENPELVEIFDALIASSHKQTAAYRAAYPHKRTVHVTHLVDTRIRTVPPQKHAFRVGYFGGLHNAKHRADLAAHVQFHESGSDLSQWIRELPLYNCHYAVRQNNPWDGFKPFTKGFLAARCQSPIIIVASDGDAAHYLGGEYPYLLVSDHLSDIIEMVERAATDFGGPRWQLALAIMSDIAKASSDTVVLAEFDTLVREYMPLRQSFWATPRRLLSRLLRSA
ncbi:hypothetical protein [Microvirga vignae]|nr:hypothetical protein [Microvirga vignae]